MNIYKVIFYSVLSYLSLWVVAPLKITYEPTVLAFYAFAFMYVALLSGARLGLNFFRHTTTPNPKFINYDSLDTTFKFLVLIVVVGIFLRMVDKLFYRSLLSYENITERRDSETQSTLLGVLSSPMYMCGLALPVFLKYKTANFYEKLLALACFIYPSIEVTFMGSRGIVITSFSMAFVYVYCLWGNLLKKIHFNVVLLIIAILIFFVSGQVFLSRISTYGMSASETALASVYAYTLIPNDYALSIIDHDEGIAATFFFLLINASQYLLHGFLELAYLIDNFKYVDYQFGMYTFSIFGKLFSYTSGYNWQPYMAPRFGIYTTLLGPLLVDFGLFAFPVIFFLGWFLAITQNKIRRGDILYMPLHAYLVSVVFFAPVVNLIQNALGIYVLVSCIIVILINRIVTPFLSLNLKPTSPH